MYYVSSKHLLLSVLSFKENSKKIIHKKIEYVVLLLFYFCIGLYKHICSGKRISARLFQGGARTLAVPWLVLKSRLSRCVTGNKRS